MSALTSTEEVGKLKRKVGELEKGKKKKKRGGRKRGAESSSDEEPEEGGERSISKPDGEHPRNFNMQRKLNVKQDVWNATFVSESFPIPSQCRADKRRASSLCRLSFEIP